MVCYLRNTDFRGLFYSYFQVTVQKTSNFIISFISRKYLQTICFPNDLQKGSCCVYLYDLKGTKCNRTCLTMRATRNNRNMWDSSQTLRSYCCCLWTTTTTTTDLVRKMFWQGCRCGGLMVAIWQGLWTRVIYRVFRNAQSWQWFDFFV